MIETLEESNLCGKRVIGPPDPSLSSPSLSYLIVRQCLTTFPAPAGLVYDPYILVRGKNLARQRETLSFLERDEKINHWNRG